MPNNQELEEQIKELRALVREQKQATSARWSDSPWAIGLQILIAVAAVAIAWAQFNAAALQTDISTKQARLQEFELIKSLSNLNPNDKIAVDNLFGYIETLDQDLQQKFVNNNLNTSSINYFTFQSYRYLFDNFEYDTVNVIGGIMTKLNDYLTERRFNHIIDLQSASEDYSLIEPWVKLVLTKSEPLAFDSYQKLLIDHSPEFINSIMALNAILNHSLTDQKSFEIIEGADQDLTLKLIPYDIRLTSILYGSNRPLSGSSLENFIEALIRNKPIGSSIVLSQIESASMAQFVTSEYFQDIYGIFLLYLKQAKNRDDFDKYQELCINMMKTQQAMRKDLKGLKVNAIVKVNNTTNKKELVASYRLWLTAEKLTELKQKTAAGAAYETLVPTPEH